eukprot:13185489-Ditylum_brightwellii.AAC.1
MQASSLMVSGKYGGAPPIALTVYKDIIFSHTIKDNMWDVFNYMEPTSKSSINLLGNQCSFKLTDIKDYITTQLTIAD